MSTIVNNPNGRDADSGSGVVTGVIIAIILLILFFVFGLPALRGDTRDVDVRVNEPVQNQPAQNQPAPNNTTNNFNSTTTINMPATTTR